jgi:threonine aldolase
MIDRLAEDHANAKILANGLQGLNGLTTHPHLVETNMVMVDTVASAPEWQARLQAAGVWCFPVAKNRLRLVTHADVSTTDVQNAIDVFSELSSQTAR